MVEGIVKTIDFSRFSACRCDDDECPRKVVRRKPLPPFEVIDSGPTKDCTKYRLTWPRLNCLTGPFDIALIGLLFIADAQYKFRLKGPLGNPMNHPLSTAAESQDFWIKLQGWPFAKAEISALNRRLPPNVRLDWTDGNKGLIFVWTGRDDPAPILGYIRNNGRIDIEISIFSILFNQRGFEPRGLNLIENYARALAEKFDCIAKPDSSKFVKTQGPTWSVAKKTAKKFTYKI
jgi:hypothetical protein